jgi:flagellar brake protein
VPQGRIQPTKRKAVVNAPLPHESRRGPPKLSDALERIAPGAEPHEMTDPFDIGESLTMLAENGDAVTIYLTATTEMIMARIESVDPELPHFVFRLNEGEFLPPGKITCVAPLRNAKLQFDLEGDWQSAPGDPTLIAADFPATCAVLNRRAAQRLETPVGMNYLATFQLHGTPYELQLYDFSMGGVGLRAKPRDAVGLHVGKKLQKVRLELGPELVMTADLEVRLRRTFRSFLLGEQVQLGCRFIDPTPAMQDDLTRLLEQTSERRKPAR